MRCARRDGWDFGADRIQGYVPGPRDAALRRAARRSRRRPATGGADASRRKARLRSYQPPPMPNRWQRPSKPTSGSTTMAISLAGKAASGSMSGSGMPKRLVTSGSPGRHGAKRSGVVVQHRQAIRPAQAGKRNCQRAGRFPRPSPSSRRRGRMRQERQREANARDQASAAAMRAVARQGAAALAQLAAQAARSSREWNSREGRRRAAGKPRRTPAGLGRLIARKMSPP
jgi:hypothetical protein